MDDLVTRLRERAAMLDESERPLSDATLAANEIERLRVALTEIASGHWVGSDGVTYTSREGRIATAALAHEDSRL